MAHSEYTNNCVTKLHKEMATSLQDNANEDNCSVATKSINSSSVENLIIKNFCENGKNKKDTDKSILATILAQRESDKIRFDKLMNRSHELVVSNERNEMKLHYNRLELNNVQVKYDQLTQNLKKCKNENRSFTMKCTYYQTLFLFSMIVNMYLLYI